MNYVIEALFWTILNYVILCLTFIQLPFSDNGDQKDL